MGLQQRVEQFFQETYGQRPSLVVRAPGRVNLIGEHTDYNDGFVLPMAIDRAIYMALRPSGNSQVTAHSLDFAATAVFDLTHLQPEASGWAEYLKGVAWALQSAGYPLQGWHGVIAGDVPLGAGLSSSAALELATARAFLELTGQPWQPTEMARLCQRAENEWVGVNCGIMDQLISAAGQAGHALLIDCRSLNSQPVPLPPATAVVILDSSTRRGLVDSAYNERRRQCEAAASFFDVPFLRDVSIAQFLAQEAELEPTIRRRARHVVTENVRVLNAGRAMQQQDAPLLGQLMNESHHSMQYDFEITNHALDTLVQIAQNHPACYGARMTGGGFGGCAVALVQAATAVAFGQLVGEQYQQATGLPAAIYVCPASNGAEIVPLLA